MTRFAGIAALQGVLILKVFAHFLFAFLPLATRTLPYALALALLSAVP